MHDLTNEPEEVRRAYQWLREAADEDPATTDHDALWNARAMAAFAGFHTSWIKISDVKPPKNVPVLLCFRGVRNPAVGCLADYGEDGKEMYHSGMSVSSEASVFAWRWLPPRPAELLEHEEARRVRGLNSAS